MCDLYEIFSNISCDNLKNKTLRIAINPYEMQCTTEQQYLIVMCKKF